MLEHEFDDEEDDQLLSPMHGRDDFASRKYESCQQNNGSYPVSPMMGLGGDESRRSTREGALFSTVREPTGVVGGEFANLPNTRRAAPVEEGEEPLPGESYFSLSPLDFS